MGLTNSDEFTPLRIDSPLSRFLSKHDDKHGIFLSHLDMTPVGTKKIAFYSALGTHLLYLAIFLWRAYRLYTSYGSPSKLYSQLSLYGIAFLCLDLYIVKVMAHAVRKFARNSFWYRLRCGFRPTEIVIRRPHPTYIQKLNALSVAEGSTLLHYELHRAMDVNTLNNRPGDALQTPEVWLVDYHACVEAYYLSRLVGPGAIEEDAWRMSVWTKDPNPTGGWKVIENWKILHDHARRDRYLQVFIDKLLALGKGHLFDPWLKLMSEEATTPTGEDLPLNMGMADARVALFESEGIDYEQFMTEIDQRVKQEFFSLNMPVGF
ncbi:hypothetical protein SCHPADRAFT_946067 [Schizopora paradoxa]|uniref:Uncharacterized protein n=1 Tax=Schizopora paradoxa TaxID=27342 RepID=A0A0H2RNU6_9AGAM|nr:hypothetical protein SCHPADRAFT_946067 [Schizopora paradoxa]